MTPKLLGCATSHSVVITDKGSVFGWGSLENLALGTAPSTEHKKSFTRPVCLSDAEEQVAMQAVACSERKTVLVNEKGEVVEWDGQVRTFWAKADTSRGPSPRAAMVSCGSHHNLVVDDLGRVWSWGSNSNGQLGHGDMNDRFEPTLIVQLEKIVIKQIAAGGRHSLVCTKDGDVSSFGFNEKGQLGIGNQIGQTSPTTIPLLVKITVRDVACGVSHSAAVSEEGSLYMFGAGSYGRCGHGSEGDCYYPVENETLARIGPVLACSLGENHSACVMEDGQLFVWGSGSFGKLGLGDDNENKLSPVPLKYGSLFRSVCCGPFHTVASTQEGSVVTWGSSSAFGRLGRSSEPARPDTVDIPIDESVGLGKSLAPPADGPSSTFAGSTHISSNVRFHRDVKFHKYTAKQISCGEAHSMILTVNGTVFTFGSNVHGQCGHPSLKLRENVCYSPEQVEVVGEGSTHHRVAHIACGKNHSILATIKGEVYSFGRGTEHQLGLGVVADKFEACLVSSLSGSRVYFVAAGDQHSACVTREGALYTWGSSDLGKLGLGRNVPRFVTYPKLVLFEFDSSLAVSDQAKSVSCAAEHTLVVTRKGKLLAFGAGFLGRLGTGKSSNEYSPVHVSFEAESVNVVEASAGNSHSTCISSKGDLFVWGFGDARLGLGDTSHKLVPTKHTAFVGTARVAVASDAHTMVMKDDGTVWCFGKNTHGRLGLGSDEDSATPEQINPQVMQLGVLETSDVENRSLASQGPHSLALSQNGQLYVWGLATLGRLGVGQPSGITEYDAPEQLNFPDTTRLIAELGHLSSEDQSLSNEEKKLMVSQLNEFRNRVHLARAQSAKAGAEIPEGPAGDSTIESDDDIPIGALQYRLKNPEATLSQLANRLKNVQDAEVRNTEVLNALHHKQSKIDHHELAIRFAINHATEAVRDGNLGTSRSLRSRHSHLYTRKQKTNSEHDNIPVTSNYLRGSIPVLERLLALLLLNPGFMFTLYKKFVPSELDGERTERGQMNVNWFQLFVGLCRDLYDLKHEHSGRLYHKLLMKIGATEIQDKNYKSFQVFLEDWRTSKFTFQILFKLFLFNNPNLSGLISEKLSEKLTSVDEVPKSNGSSASADLIKKVAVDVFEVFVKVVSEIVLPSFPAIATAASDFVAFLRATFLSLMPPTERTQEVEADIHLLVARLLLESLVIPVLLQTDEFVGEKGAQVHHIAQSPQIEILTGVRDFLFQALTSRARSVGRTGEGGPSLTQSYKEGVVFYETSFRHLLESEDRLQLDVLLADAKREESNENLQAFLDSLDRKRVEKRVGQYSLAEGSSRLFSSKGAQDVFRSLRTRSVQLTMDLVNRTAASSVDVDLVQDLALTRLEPTLVLYPTERTLNFVNYALFSSARQSQEADANEDLSAKSEWDVLMEFCRNYAENMTLFQVDDFTSEVTRFNDSWGITVVLNLAQLDFHAGKGDFSRISSMCRLDSVTRTPIPNEWSQYGQGDADVFGVNMIEQGIEQPTTPLGELVMQLPQMRSLDRHKQLLELSNTTWQQTTDAPIPVNSQEYEKSAIALLDSIDFVVDSLNRLGSVQLSHDSMSRKLEWLQDQLNERESKLQAFSRVMRDGDQSKARKELERISQRRMGKAYKLTEFDFIRSVQLQRSGGYERDERGTQSRSCFGVFRSCMAVSDPGNNESLMERRKEFSDNGLVSGAYASYSYDWLSSQGVIFRNTEPRTSQLTTEQSWDTLTRRMMFHFALSNEGIFSVQLVFHLYTIIAQVQVAVPELLNYTRTFTLNWTPEGFPVTFRLSKLIRCIQEMTLQAMM